jgi:serine/threonine protein kinase
MDFSGGMDRFGPYELIRPIGRGGTADVFEARHAGVGNRVALKVLRAVVSSDHNTVLGVLREARAAMAVIHPNVVRVFDAGTHNRIPYLVMELLEGEDLAKRLARERRLSLEETTSILFPIISAVCAAHATGCIHRDLKPSNIFLAVKSGCIEPVVLDFGISKVTDSTPGDTSMSGVALGTPRYMAPEQIRGSRPSPLIDQYALGVVTYECITGSPPFSHENRYDLQQAIMSGALAPPSAINEDIPVAFDQVVLRALSRNPSSRFPNLYALGAALLPFASVEVTERWKREFDSANEASEDDVAQPTLGSRPLPSGVRTIVTSATSMSASSDQTEPVWANDVTLESRRRVRTPFVPNARGVMTFDGVAAVVKGDTLTMVWSKPARIHRSKWIFDIADNLAQSTAGGIVSLMILLPTSTHPDAPTRRENRVRMTRLAPNVRRWVSVVTGDLARDGQVLLVVPGYGCRSLDLGRHRSVAQSRQQGHTIG